jgi:hypothetical protein
MFDLSCAGRVAVVSVICLVLGISGPCAANIPPPQHFEKPAAGGKTPPLLVIVADDASVPGTQVRPRGKTLATDSYCKMVLDVLAGPGARAFIIVKGSSDQSETSDGHWSRETAPIEIRGPSDGFATTTYVVPLRHDVTSIDLSPSDQGDAPFYGQPGLSVGGPIDVYATGVSCSADTTGWR